MSIAKQIKNNWSDYFLYAYVVLIIMIVSTGGLHPLYLALPAICVIIRIALFAISKGVKKKLKAFKILLNAEAWIVISSEGDDYEFSGYISRNDLKVYCPGIHDYFQRTDGAVDEVNKILSEK